jgi:hypothetical protein
MIIYQSTYYANDEDAKQQYEEYAKEYNETLSEEGYYEWLNADNGRWFEDERDNLNKPLDEDIIAIASLGLWDGRRSGYKMLGNNLKSIFNCWKSCDDIKLYTYKNNVLGEGIHHDGRNYITFRKFKQGLSDACKDKLLNAIYNGSIDMDKYIKRYTKSIYYDVKEVYGMS